jgi:hypothetical protein
MMMRLHVSAEAFNLSLLPPSIPEEKTGQFATGANFAVFASIALPPAYYKSKYNFTMSVPSDLGAQLDSFKRVLARIAPGESKLPLTFMVHASLIDLYILRIIVSLLV